MHDPTVRDRELADRVSEIARDAFPISTDGPQPESVRREMIARAARAQRRAYEQARSPGAAMPKAVRPSPFYQPFGGAVILRNGEPWWGPFWCCGVYLPNGAERAQRAMMERDHAEAVRRNDWMDRQRVRFTVTEAGRAALAEPDASARRIAS